MLKARRDETTTTVPFVVAGTLFVVLVLIVGLVAVISPAITEALSFARSNSKSVLDGAERTLGQVSTIAITAGTNLGSSMLRISDAYLNRTMIEIRSSILRSIMDDNMEAVDAAFYTTHLRPGLNLTKPSQAIALLDVMLTPRILTQERAIAISGGLDLRYQDAALDRDGGTSQEMVDSKGQVFRSVTQPLKLDFLYAASWLSKPPYNWNVTQAGAVLSFTRADIPDLFDYLGRNYPNYLETARNYTLWGLSVNDQGDQVRIVRPGDRGYDDPNAEVINSTFKRLYPIDDPEKNCLTIKFLYDILEHKIVPGSLCGQDISVSRGTCWGSVWNDTRPQTPQIFRCNDTDCNIPTAFFSAYPFSSSNLRFLDVGYLHYPRSVPSGLPPHPGHANPNLSHHPAAIMGMIAITSDIDALQTSLRLDNSPFNNPVAVLHSSTGYFISSSLPLMQLPAKAVVTVADATCVDSSGETLAYALFVESTNRWDNLTSHSGTLCIPGPLVIAARQFALPAARGGYCKMPTSVQFERITDPKHLHLFQLADGTNMTSLPCGAAAYPNDHPEDLIVTIARIHDAGTDYLNASGPPPSWNPELRRIAPDNFIGEVILAVLVKFSDIQKESIQSLAMMTDANNNASASIRNQRTAAHSQTNQKQSFLLQMTVGIAIGVSILIVLVAASLFYMAVRPLRFVILALEYVENFDLANASIILDQLSTIFTEFHRTKEGVSAMIDRLVEYRRFLPEWVIAQEDDGDAEVPKPMPSVHLEETRKSSHRQRSASNSSRTSHAQEPVRHQNILGDLVLESKEVVTLVLHLPLQNFDVSRVNAVLASWLPQVEVLVRRFKGSMSPDIVSSSNEGITVVVLFNAQTACRNMVSNALDCASAIAQIELKLPTISNFRVASGVSCKSTVCGSVGTNTQRWYVASGSSGVIARALATAAVGMNQPILCEANAFNRTSTEHSAYNHLNVGAIHITGLRSGPLRCGTISVVDRLEQSEQEWMYMLEDAQQNLSSADSAEAKFARIAELINASEATHTPKDVLEAAIQDAHASVVDMHSHRMHELAQGFLTAIEGALAVAQGSDIMSIPAAVSTFEFAPLRF